MDKFEFKEACRSRRLCWGTAVSEHANAHVVRTMARAGFEWLWLENEHAHQSYETVRDVARTCEDVGIVCIMRVAQAEYTLIAKALDIGVHGIIVPRVETPEQVRYIVDCAKYPPIGKRGFGIRAMISGQQSMQGRIRDQNEDRSLIVQVESRRAVENVEALLDAGDGQIDALIFGPADFQMDVGRPDEPYLPELDAAARRVASVCAERGVSACVPLLGLEFARLWRERGFNLLSYGSDDYFFTSAAKQAREELNEIT